MRPSTSASQACGSMPLSLAVSIRVNMAAARSPPRSEPANSQDLRPIQRSLGRVVVEGQPSIIEAADESGPARPHVAEGGGELGFARQFGPGLIGPGGQPRRNRFRSPVAFSSPVVGLKALD